MKKNAVFLDRDGTINVDAGYPSDYGQVEVYPRSYEAVRRLNSAGLPVIVLTNQSGIGRGLLTEENLRTIHEKMKASFQQEKARLDAFYYCPHYELSAIPRYRLNCDCRKPNPGLALKAAADFGLDLARSYMVGDKVEDIVLGLNIKASPVLVLTGYGEESLKKLAEIGVKPAHVAVDILDAAVWILAREKKAAKPVP
ncbi:MAG: HAD family hydrolase [Clostridiales bacterium]|nr:HAD family hydrolase [Clostridiales bacterium]